MSPSPKILFFGIILLGLSISIDETSKLKPSESTEPQSPDHDPKILTSKTQQDGIIFTYGSCFRQWNVKTKGKVFNTIASENSDFWLWLGDAIYPTSRFFDLSFMPKTLASFSQVKNYYDELKYSKPYQNLRISTRIIGIWDDHDYGMGDGDSTNPAKDEMKKLYLDFIDESMDSPRQTPNRGLWISHYLDTDKQAKLILLDGHYDRVGEDDLGPEQRKWLHDEIMGEQDSQIFIIANGYPLVDDLLLSGDKFSKFTRHQIFKLVNMKRHQNGLPVSDKSKKNSFFIGISGEVHFGMISQRGFLETPGRKDDFYDLTSSGLSHHLSKFYSPDQQIGNFYSLPKDRYYGYNYGTIDIRQAGGKCVFGFSVRDENGLAKLRKEFDCGMDTVVDETEREGLTQWDANLEYQKETLLGFRWWHFWAVFRNYVEQPVLWSFAKFVTAVFYLFAHRWVLKRI